MCIKFAIHSVSQSRVIALFIFWLIPLAFHRKSYNILYVKYVHVWWCFRLVSHSVSQSVKGIVYISLYLYNCLSLYIFSLFFSIYLFIHLYIYFSIYLSTIFFYLLYLLYFLFTLSAFFIPNFFPLYFFASLYLSFSCSKDHLIHIF